MDALAGENLTCRFGDFEIEAGRRILRSRLTGAVVPLTGRAFDLLLLLVQRPNVLVTKDELIAALWPDTVVEDNNLEQAVFALRQALGERRGEYRYIKTIHRRGYQFTAKVDLVVAAPPALVLDPPAETPASPPARRRITMFAIAGAIALVLAITLTVLLSRDPAAPAPVATAPQAPEVGALAVRRFRQAAAEDEGLLGDGMARLLEQRFSGIVGLPVISLDSSLHAGKPEEGSAAIGRRLNARFVLGGDVSRSGERLHVAVTLTDCGSDKVLWSQTFDQPVAELTAIREEIVAQSVKAMHVPAAVADPAINASIDPEAYEIYMRGVRLMRAGAPIADIEKATVLFSRATVLDPRFARGYLGVAVSLMYAQSLKPHLAHVTPSEGTEQARAALDRALELNPALGEAWIHKALLISDPVEADRMFRHGIGLKPNYSVGSMFYASFLMESDRAGEAIDVIDRARRLDPMSAVLLTLQAHTVMASRSDVVASERLLRQALDMEGGAGVAGISLAVSLQVNHGEFAEALRLMQRLTPDASARAMMAMMYLDMDDVAAADRVWKEADPSPQFTLMVISQYRRETGNAAQMARRMIAASREDLFDYAAQSLRDEAVATGNFADALRALEPVYEAHPSLSTMATVDHEFAIVFAHVLILSGQVERGTKLARTLLVSLDGDEIGRPPHWFARERAELFAMLGEDDKALDELAADQQLNHWSRWWYTGEIDPVFAHLRKDPRFIKLVANARAQRAAQRALFEEMRRRGEVR